MNDSVFYYKLIRNLYFITSAKTLSGPWYYVYFLKKVTKLALNHPQIFIKRSLETLFKKPKGLIDVFARRYLIQSWEPQSVRLKKTNDEYYDWIEKVETEQFDHKRQAAAADKLKYQPLISLITPVFNPPVQVHKELIDSVINQTYGKLELLLYNFGDDPAVRALLDEYAEKDSRVRVKHGLPNQGISKNSNLCLKDAKGEYVGLLDHDDALTPDALFECVKAINEHGADFVYTDKDMMTEQGRRFDPLFKPDWSPEMELCGNYLTHFDIMRTSLVKELGGWDAETDGAQDWDLFWRIAEKTDKIAHVPKILYHWRTVEGSTSNHITAKPYVLKGQIRTIEKHLKNVGWQAVPYHDWTGQMYVDWPKTTKPAIFVLHLAFKGAGEAHLRSLKRLIKEIDKSEDFAETSKLIVFCLKNRAAKKTKEALRGIQSVSLCEYEPGEFIEMFIDKLSSDSTENVFYVSDSIRKISKDTGDTTWISQLQGWLNTPEIGMVGGLTHAPDGRVVDCGSFFDKSSRNFYKFYFGTGHRSGYIGHLQWTRNFILPSERLFAFKTELISNIKKSDIDLTAFRDDELPKLIALENFAAGYRAVYDPSVTSVDRAPFYVILPPSSGMSKNLGSRYSRLQESGDPYYNPNLRIGGDDPKPFISTQAAQPANFEVRAAEGLLVD